MQTSTVLSFPPPRINSRIPRDPVELKEELGTFIRLATSLRAEPVRSQGEVAAVEQNIDALRIALDYPPLQFGGFTDGELSDAIRFLVRE